MVILPEKNSLVNQLGGRQGRDAIFNVTSENNGLKVETRASHGAINFTLAKLNRILRGNHKVEMGILIIHCLCLLAKTFQNVDE